MTENQNHVLQVLKNRGPEPLGVSFIRQCVEGLTSCEILHDDVTEALWVLRSKGLAQRIRHPLATCTANRYWVAT